MSRTLHSPRSSAPADRRRLGQAGWAGWSSLQARDLPGTGGQLLPAAYLAQPSPTLRTAQRRDLRLRRRATPLNNTASPSPATPRGPRLRPPSACSTSRCTEPHRVHQARVQAMVRAARPAALHPQDGGRSPCPPVAKNYMNRSLIPSLCAKAGVPTADVRGNITSTYSTIASELYNAKEPMTLFRAAGLVGTRPHRTRPALRGEPTRTR